MSNETVDESWMPKKFANVILTAAKIRDESYDNEAAQAAMTEHEGFVNLDKFYTKSLRDSITEACKQHELDPLLTGPIYLCMYWWNDAISWARVMLGIKED